MKARPLAVVAVNVLVFAVLVLLIEAVTQGVALVRPAYDVLFLQPHRVLGWTQPPNLHWTWTGTYWYARDFSVPVVTNPLGFRDLARDFAKPAGTARVALLGDSYIEAVQVPLAQTAAQVLERELNAAPAGASGAPAERRKWEVLNFGISNYGVGQYLLVWEQYVHRFRPDYVAIFTAKYHMQRTVKKYEYGAFPTTASESLWVRPTFRVEGDSLVREPARDYDRFVQIQEDLVRRDFGGQRVRRKPLRWHTLDYGRQFVREVLMRTGLRPLPTTTIPGMGQEPDSVLYAVNLRIIAELGRQVAGSGAKLVVLDASRYVGEDASVSDTLQKFCAERGFGYVPVYQDLIRANEEGTATRWAHDGHFNAAGDRIVAQALFGWITQDVRRSAAP